MGQLITAPPPPLDVPTVRASVSVEEYDLRIRDVVARLRDRELDFLVVYADREHCAHQAYLCGVEPRFEESLLILSSSDDRTLLLGNECQAFAPDPALGIEVRLFQDFSPLGQKRSDSIPLTRLLRDAKLASGSRVGCAGWKSLTNGLVHDAPTALDVPSYIADALRAVTADQSLVTNENAIFVDIEDGVRITCSAAQIAEFELAACATSSGVRDAVMRLRPGIREYEIERSFVNYGLPLSCHNMVSFGAKARRGLSSPSHQEAVLGDPFTLAFGLRGSLTCRAGAIAASAQDLTNDVRDFYPEFASNYFDVVASWYDAVRVGVAAGDVYARVDDVRDDGLFDFLLNPGHLLHVEEWSQSPFAEGNKTVLRSGMVMQLDIIPVVKGPFCYANVEDGVVLADEKLRAELETKYPDLWRRVQTRRHFMTEVIGIEPHESVLPLSNIPGWFPPYALNTRNIFAR